MLFSLENESFIEITKLLLEKNVEIDAFDNSTQTALHYAAFQGHTDRPRVLFQNSQEGMQGGHMLAYIRSHMLCSPELRT